MEHLWAPWRNAYVTASDATGKENKEKLFLTIGQSSDDEANFVFLRSKSVFAVLNRFPYNAGHTLIVPYREVCDLRDLADDEQKDLWDTVNQVSGMLERAFQPNGFNIGINVGAAAGAGIPSHLHVHVVPRWQNDVNFMTTQTETRVHPADLKEIYQKLKTAS
ncbi:MAG: HIT domain-containing protein [Verrucomicrobiota bacterium]